MIGDSRFKRDRHLFGSMQAHVFCGIKIAGTVSHRISLNRGEAEERSIDHCDRPSAPPHFPVRSRASATDPCTRGTTPRGISRAYQIAQRRTDRTRRHPYHLWRPGSSPERKAITNAQQVLQTIFNWRRQRDSHPALLPVDIR